MSFSNDAQGVDLPASAALEPAAPPPAPSPASDLPGSGSDLEAVPQPLRDALARRGFARLTEVQHAVLRALADEGAARDLRLSSQTGSGKTVAIGLALAPGLAAPVEPARPRLAALLVVPTRELAEQVARELRWLFAGLPEAAIECVTGGTSVGDEQRRLGRGPRVLVATPGRLLDHVRSGALDPSGVSQLVLDEADQMLDLGFRDDLDAILAALPAQRRTILVSATFPREVERLVERFQREPLLVTGTAPGAANADIEHRVYRVAPRDRYAALVNLLLCADGERALVFVRTRRDAADLAERLAKDGFAAAAISGELAQAQRTRTLHAFRGGVVRVLVATDVAARGIDVAGIGAVVHFDLPADAGVYTHRSGRTGRAGRKGTSIVLAPPSAAHRAQRILRAASVHATFADAPGPAEVEAARRQRLQERLAALLAADAPAAREDRAIAAAVLAERDPVEVVARLLAAARGSERAPMPLSASAPARTPPTAPAPRADGWVRFEIAWGARTGATPQRLLAHVCRRGGISGRHVGAISVQPFTATFEVDAAVAAPFAARTRVPGPDEPGLRLARAGSARATHRRRRP